MTLSFAITVCDERKEVERLLDILINSRRKDLDEIVVLLDTSKEGSKDVEKFLSSDPYSSYIKLYKDTFTGDFSEWKNKLSSYCTKEYIFQLDADEYFSPSLIQVLSYILDNNEVEVLGLGRINTVEGITQQHIEKWGWNLNDKGWVNFPDIQYRVYKNTDSIKWVNKVHEHLFGFENYGIVPPQESYCLKHPKGIEKQERQNNLYSSY